MALLHDLLHLAHPGVGHLAAHLEAARDAGDVDRLDDGAAVLDVDRQGRAKSNTPCLSRRKTSVPLRFTSVTDLMLPLRLAAGSSGSSLVQKGTSRSFQA